MTKQAYTKAWNEEFGKTGVFFAFSNEQFEENKTHQEGKYYFIGAGGYIHESNIEKYKYFVNVTEIKLQKEYQQKIKKEDLIKYELLNHECYYTGNVDEALEAVQAIFPKTTLKEVKRVFNKNAEYYLSIMG